jgi:hypothetical protein
MADGSNLPPVIPEVAAIGTATTAGAIIGSVVPGIGTAIGAGVGAVVAGVGVIVHEVKKRNEGAE